MTPVHPAHPHGPGRLVVVTGKGGVGKSTVAAALGIAAVAAGHRTVVCELGRRGQIPPLLGSVGRTDGRPALSATAGLWTAAVSPDAALAEWLSQTAGRAAAALLTRSSAMAILIAAAPGARELITIGKVWELTRDRGSGAPAPFDVVVLDAPSTGHAIALLGAPATYAGMAAGRVRDDAAAIRDAIASPSRTVIVGVAEPAELPVSELLFLEDRLREALGRGLTAVMVNRRVPRRFSAADIDQIDARLGDDGVARACQAHRVRRSAQDTHVARLRRELPLPCVELPLLITDALGPADAAALALPLGRVLEEAESVVPGERIADGCR